MKIALVGNQNSGKSTLFNTLTGGNQKIGNWPGVTIERKVGKIRNTNYELIDLPGTYSLNPYTNEEAITTEFILREETDVIINVIDCNSIARGMYLTMQLLELNKNVIIALNMYELAEKKGIKIDSDKLSVSLGNIPVIKISALTGESVGEVIAELNKIKSKKAIDKLKFLKKDVSEEEIMAKYKTIDRILNESLIKEQIEKRKSITDILDKIFLNKFLAIPIFAGVMFAIYYFSIDIVGNNTIDLIKNFFEQVTIMLENVLIKTKASTALISLLIDGIISGVSAVISFLPQLTFLFVSISFLEKIGYMSRISLIFDKSFKGLGISGNSIISFIIGTGCSVPGIMATRTIKNEKEKKITAILTPFVPCSAKLPIITLFSSYFFRNNSGIIALSFYFVAIIVIIFSALLLKKLNEQQDETSYISELPEYRVPKIKQIIRDSLERVFDFIKRAGSIILLSSVFIWLLLSFSPKLEYGINVENSILASMGRTFSWLFMPMVGENSWEVAVSVIQGLIAKEQVISSMSIIAGLESENIVSSVFAIGSPFDFFTPAASYAFVCFNLFSAPCFGAISAMKKTLGSTKNTIKAVGYQTGLAYILSCLIYSGANLMHWW